MEKSLKTKNVLNTHYRIVHKLFTGSFSCTLCSYKGKTDKILEMHKKTNHNGMDQLNKKLKCDICGHKASTIHFHYKHMASEHGYNYKKCTICKKAFNKSSTLLNHKRDVHGKINECTSGGM